MCSLCAVRAIHHPLNLLNPLNPHTEGVSKGDTTTFGPQARQTYEP